MSYLGRALTDLERHVGAFTLEVFAKLLPPEWVTEVLRTTGTASRRRRRLPAELVSWLLVAMGLYRNLSVPNVWARLSEGFRGALGAQGVSPPASTSLTEARDRLGVEPLRLLFDRLAGSLRTRFNNLHLWRGLLLTALDGSVVKVPDSPENRAHFGAPGSWRGRSGYPFLRFVTLLAVQTHIVLSAVMGGWNTGEIPLALRLLGSIESGSLVLMDRGFWSCWLLWGILRRDSHFLIRTKRRLTFRGRRRLGPGEWLAEFVVSRAARAEHPELPESIPVRLIRHHVRGFRPCLLATSLLDPAAYPAEELAALYHERWELEIAYDELKTHQAATPVLFRSQRPDRVLQEAYGLLLGYNLVRGLMAEAAVKAGVPPRRLSFVAALERVDRGLLRMAAAPAADLPEIYDAMLDSIGRARLPPRRPRRYPRAVKVKMSSYPLKRGRRRRIA